MTTMLPEDFKCPNCGHKFQDNVLMSTNYQGQRTDFQRITSGYNPLLFLIHSCQECGFTGSSSAFEGTVEPGVAEQIKSNVWPHVRDERLAADARWEFAARISEWRGESNEATAGLYLNAAWCADEPVKEMYYRRKAADYFEQALEGQPSDRLAITYLIGELYRRVGETAVAVTWFDRAIDGAGTDPGGKQLKELALRQKTEPGDVI